MFGTGEVVPVAARGDMKAWVVLWELDVIEISEFCWNFVVLRGTVVWAILTD